LAGAWLLLAGGCATAFLAVVLAYVFDIAGLVLLVPAVVALQVADSVLRPFKADTRAYALSDPEQDGPPWQPETGEVYHFGPPYSAAFEALKDARPAGKTRGGHWLPSVARGWFWVHVDVLLDERTQRLVQCPLMLWWDQDEPEGWFLGLPARRVALATLLPTAVVVADSQLGLDWFAKFDMNCDPKLLSSSATWRPPCPLCGGAKDHAAVACGPCLSRAADEDPGEAGEIRDYRSERGGYVRR